jgi:hypothetical protein
MGIQDVCTPQIMWVEEQRAHVGTIYFCLFHIQMVLPYGPQGQPGTRAHQEQTPNINLPLPEQSTALDKNQLYDLRYPSLHRDAPCRQKSLTVSPTHPPASTTNPFWKHKMQQFLPLPDLHFPPGGLGRKSRRS